MPFPPPPFSAGWVDPSVMARTKALLQKCRLPTEPPPGLSPARVMELMAVDKKGAGHFILLKGPLGGCVFTDAFDPAALQATLKAFCR